MSPSDNEIILNEVDNIELDEEMQLLAKSPESIKNNEINPEDQNADLQSLIEKESISPEESSRDEHIATTVEDFEELIDGEKRDDKIQERPDTRHILEIHKYASSSPYTFNSKSNPVLKPTKKTSPQISQVSSPIRKSPEIIPESDTVSSISSSISSPQMTDILRNSQSNIIPLENTLLKSSLQSSSIMTTIMSLSPQDTALPSKIFQDESGSPEESEENNEPDSPIEKFTGSILQEMKKKEDAEILNSSGARQIKTSTNVGLPISVINASTSNVLQQYMQANKQPKGL